MRANIGENETESLCSKDSPFVKAIKPVTMEDIPEVARESQAQKIFHVSPNRTEHLEEYGVEHQISHLRDLETKSVEEIREISEHLGLHSQMTSGSSPMCNFSDG